MIELHDKYQVCVAEVKTFREQGFLRVPGLVGAAEVEELRAHTMDLIHGRVEVLGLEPPASGMSPEEIEQRYLRIHMLHRHLEIHERYLLHPRILDVLEVLIGPDVMAMQTMLFVKPPGKPGQGYHQDSYYIKTLPDTLCGAWICLDDADEENGCMYFVPGSQYEPIHAEVRTPEDPEEHQPNLIEVVDVERDREVPVTATAGDVVFFDGHVLHRSGRNRSATRFRRAFVGHYANARSYTEWGGGNKNHILARGRTHLEYALPKFGTRSPL